MRCSPQLTAFRSKSAAIINGYFEGVLAALDSGNHEYISYWEEEVRKMPQHQWTAFAERLK